MYYKELFSGRLLLTFAMILWAESFFLRDSKEKWKKQGIQPSCCQCLSMAFISNLELIQLHELIWFPFDSHSHGWHIVFWSACLILSLYLTCSESTKKTPNLKQIRGSSSRLSAAELLLAFLGPTLEDSISFQVFQILPWEKHQLLDNKTRVWASSTGFGKWSRGSQSILSNQSVLKEIIPEYSLEGLILSWSSLATWYKELTHWERLWRWERLRAGGEGGNRGWDGLMALPTQQTGTWTNSEREWKTGKPDVLQSMGSQRVGNDCGTEKQQQPIRAGMVPLPWKLSDYCLFKREAISTMKKTLPR